MRRLFSFLPAFSLSNLSNYRYFAVVAGFLATALVLYLMSDLLEIHKIWVVVSMVLLVMMWGGYQWWRHRRAKKAHAGLASDLLQPSDHIMNSAEPGQREKVEIFAGTPAGSDQNH